MGRLEQQHSQICCPGHNLLIDMRFDELKHLLRWQRSPTAKRRGRRLRPLRALSASANQHHGSREATQQCLYCRGRQ